MENEKLDWLAVAHGAMAHIKERRRQRKMEKRLATGNFNGAAPLAAAGAMRGICRFARFADFCGRVSAIAQTVLCATKKTMNAASRGVRFFARRKKDAATIALIGFFFGRCGQFCRGVPDDARARHVLGAKLGAEVVVNKKPSG